MIDINQKAIELKRKKINAIRHRDRLAYVEAEVDLMKLYNPDGIYINFAGC